jgi:hypothetical protein
MRASPMPRSAHPDATDWEWRVLATDRNWLARPAPEPDAAPANAEPWTRVIADSWSFDHPQDAHDAATAHGRDPDEFRVIRAPRRPGEWLAVSTSPEVAATSPYGAGGRRAA